MDKLSENYFHCQGFPKQKSAGFTLIEVMLAVFILSVGITAILQAFPLGTHIQRSSQMNTIAIQLNQAKLEEIISKSYSEVSLGIVTELYGSIANFSSFQRKTETTYFDPNNPAVPPASDLGIKKIEVTVFYRSPLGVAEKQVKLATLIARR